MALWILSAGLVLSQKLYKLYIFSFFFSKQFTPYRRGFDHFFGYLGSHIDYWSYEYGGYSTYPLGYDMRRNLDVDRSYNRTYATDMFTNEAVNLIASHNTSQPLFLLLNHLAPHAANEHDPLQAPEEIIKLYEYIPDLERRKLAGE
jgi:arylsulfatase B